VVYRGISQLSLVFSSYTEKKIQVTRGIFHGIPLESVE